MRDNENKHGFEEAMPGVKFFRKGKKEEWKTVFRQTYPYLWSSTDDPANVSLNELDPESDNYSILDSIENYRNGRGNFHFRQGYYTDSSFTEFSYTEWIQTNNLTTDVNVSGYRHITGTTSEGFGGLKRAEGTYFTNRTWIKGTTYTNWWHPVALHGHGNISAGYPILGDSKYKLIDMKKNKNKNLMLHSYKINFSINGIKHKYFAELPFIFKKTLKEKYLKISWL